MCQNVTSYYKSKSAFKIISFSNERKKYRSVFHLFSAQANSRNALLDDKASAVPYFLRSRVPLGNASNVIGHSKAADKLPKVIISFYFIAKSP